MILSDFYTQVPDSDDFTFTREQGSRFAKEIAGDFNPLHDVQAKKFCIPGDLMFSVCLAQLGVSKKMHFTFKGMVNDGTQLSFLHNEENISVLDSDQKEYLTIARSGEISQDEKLATLLAENYVAFSGHTFPHLLVPLMLDHDAMINPARPLVIYQSMSIDLERLDFTDIALDITRTNLTVEGKRGRAVLQFCFRDGEEIIGHGEKIMILSGLRSYDADVMNTLVVDYNERKQNYLN